MRRICMFFMLVTVFLSLSGCMKEEGSGSQKSVSQQPLVTESAKSEQPPVTESAKLQQPTVTEGTKPQQDSKAQSQGMSLEEIVKGETYLLHYKGTVTFEGQSYETDVTFATNGEDTSIQNVMGDITGYILVKDGITYQIDNDAKTYTPIYDADGTENVLDTSDLESSGTSSAEVFGKTLPYKEYTDGDETTRFYFDGEKLYAVAVNSSESESLLQVIELTNQVPANMLELPSGYVEAELEYPEMEASE